MGLEAYETLAEIRKQLSLMEFASLPAIVKTAQNLSKKVDSMTNFELASVISKDPFATAKVLDLANKRGMDRVSVTKLEDAILSAGYGKVKAIAFKLLDMEHIKEKMRHQEQQEAAGIGLCSCLLAEELMAIEGNYSADEVYISTILRSYGKVLLAAFLIDNYRECQLLATVRGEKSAFIQSFGITPIDLTYELLMDTKLPKEIIRTMKPLDPQLLEEEILATNKTDDLIIFGQYVYELTKAIFDTRMGADKFDDWLVGHVEKYKKRLSFHTGHLMDAIMCLDGDIQTMEEKYDIQPLPQSMIDTVSARANEEDPPKQFIGMKGGGNDAEIKKSPDEVIKAAINQIMSTCSKKEINVQKIQDIVLRAMIGGLGVQECILLEKDDNEKTLGYHITKGEGDMFKSLSKRGMLKPKNDVIEIVTRCEGDGILFDCNKPELKNFIPIWMSVDNVHSAFIYNMKDMDPPFLVVAMRNKGDKLAVGGKVMKALQEMRFQSLKSRKPKEFPEKGCAINFKPFLGALKDPKGYLAAANKK